MNGEVSFPRMGVGLAYQSNVSGRFEVYVRPFPGLGGHSQISTGGGALSTWSRTRKELFYRADDQRLMVVPYTAEGDAFRGEKPRVWSEAHVEAIGRTFDLHPDGRRFAVLKSLAPGAETRLDHVTLIFNFGDELRRIAPPRQR